MLCRSPARSVEYIAAMRCSGFCRKRAVADEPSSAWPKRRRTGDVWAPPITEPASQAIDAWTSRCAASGPSVEVCREAPGAVDPDFGGEDASVVAGSAARNAAEEATGRAEEADAVAAVARDMPAEAGAASVAGHVAPVIAGEQRVEAGGPRRARSGGAGGEGRRRC